MSIKIQKELSLPMMSTKTLMSGSDVGSGVDTIDNSVNDRKEAMIKGKTQTHSRNGSLRQRLECAEQMVHKFVTEAEQVAEQAVLKLCTEAWNVCHFNALPKWLEDNDFIHRGYRP